MDITEFPLSTEFAPNTTFNFSEVPRNVTADEETILEYGDYTGDMSYMKYLDAIPWIWKIGGAVLLVAGTVGNLLTIIVFRRRGMKQSTLSTYFIVLAIFDTLSLYNGLLRKWINEMWGIDVRKVNMFLCKVNTFGTYFLSDMSAWVLVVITIDRAISLSFPQGRPIRCTKKAGIVALVTVFFFLICLNSHILYFANLPAPGKYCGWSTSAYSKFITSDWRFIDLTAFALLPSLLIVSGNTMIVMKIYKTKRAVKRISGRSRSDGRGDKSSSVTAMLAITNAVFMVSTVPSAISIIVVENWEYNGDANELAILELIYSCSQLMMYINNALNFYLYCISGSRFRRELKHIFSPKEARRSLMMDRCRTYSNSRHNSVKNYDKSEDVYTIDTGNTLI